MFSKTPSMTTIATKVFEDQVAKLERRIDERVTKAVTSAIINDKADFDRIRKDNHQFKADCQKSVNKALAGLKAQAETIPQRVEQETKKAVHTQTLKLAGTVERMKQSLSRFREEVIDMDNENDENNHLHTERFMALTGRDELIDDTLDLLTQRLNLQSERLKNAYFVFTLNLAAVAILAAIAIARTL
jgi:hypothetical protein